MKGMKFRIESPKHSETLQGVLFALGYSWPGGCGFSHQDARYIYVRGKWLKYGNDPAKFLTAPEREIDVEWMRPADEAAAPRQAAIFTGEMVI